MPVSDNQDARIRVTGGQRGCQRERLLQVGSLVGDFDARERGIKLILIGGRGNHYLWHAGHSDEGDLVARPKPIDQIRDAAASGFKAAGGNIGGLHTGRCLQNDDGIAADGAAKKGSRAREHEYDDDGCQYLQEQQKRDVQSLPGSAGLQIL